MPMSSSLRAFLDAQGIQYEIVEHPRSVSAPRIAAVAHVPGARLAKSVLLEDEQGYVMAVVPSTRRVDLARLHRHTHRMLGLAVEEEIAQLFQDCDPGAIPAVGAAFGIKTVVDDSLRDQPDIYFEAGDHEALVHLSQQQFNTLMSGSDHGPISHAA